MQGVIQREDARCPHESDHLLHRRVEGAGGEVQTAESIVVQCGTAGNGRILKGALD